MQMEVSFPEPFMAWTGLRISYMSPAGNTEPARQAGGVGQPHTTTEARYCMERVAENPRSQGVGKSQSPTRHWSKREEHGLRPHLLQIQSQIPSGGA